jgi:hypothetical protein
MLTFNSLSLIDESSRKYSVILFRWLVYLIPSFDVIYSFHDKAFPILIIVALSLWWTPFWLWLYLHHILIWDDAVCLYPINLHMDSSAIDYLNGLSKFFQSKAPHFVVDKRHLLANHFVVLWYSFFIFFGYRKILRRLSGHHSEIMFEEGKVDSHTSFLRLLKVINS